MTQARSKPSSTMPSILLRTPAVHVPGTALKRILQNIECKSRVSSLAFCLLKSVHPKTIKKKIIFRREWCYLSLSVAGLCVHGPGHVLKASLREQFSPGEWLTGEKVLVGCGGPLRNFQSSSWQICLLGGSQLHESKCLNCPPHLLIYP